MILKILSFLFVFHTLLLADNTLLNESQKIESSDVVKAKSSVVVKEEVDVSFGNESVLYMLVLTSLLGSFFLRDELADSFE